jgi:outer membrane lipoprotein SlyB
MKRVVIALLTSGLVACATARPILYENQKYREVGGSGAARDIAECGELADQAGATPGAGKAGQAAKSAGVGAVGGAAAGAVGGAIGGSPGIGAAAGSASGVVWSLFSSMFGWMTPSQPSGAHVNYVNMCLAERGYQVAGWK